MTVRIPAALQEKFHTLQRTIAPLSSKKAKNIFRIVLTVLLVAAVNRNLTVSAILDLFRSFKTVPVIAALVLGIAGLWFQVLRWKQVLRYQHFSIDNKKAAKNFLWGSLLGFLTPGRLGELGRGLGLDPARKSDSIIAAVVDRLSALAITVLLGIFGMLFQIVVYRIYPDMLFASLSAGLFLGVLLLYIIFMRKPLSIVILHRRIDDFFRKLQRGSPPVRSLSGLKINFYSLCAQVVLLMQTAMLLYMFGIHDLIAGFIAAGQAYSFMIFLPFFIANMGLREYSFTLFLNRLHFHIENGAGISTISLGVSTFILLNNIIIPAICGLIWSHFDKSSPSNRTPEKDVKTEEEKQAAVPNTI
jgi:hypothetical protein